jgi:hypothetical protein
MTLFEKQTESKETGGMAQQVKSFKLSACVQLPLLPKDPTGLYFESKFHMENYSSLGR